MLVNQVDKLWEKLISIILEAIQLWTSDVFIFLWTKVTIDYLLVRF